MKERIDYIDILKFIAAILITNSHLDVYEPLYKIGTGGAIGDVIFFFCSGFSLFLGKEYTFLNWYKRRIKRILPSVLCWGVLSVFIFNLNTTIKYFLLSCGGWFIQCILIYYIIAYPIKKIFFNSLKLIFFLVCLITVICFYYYSNQDGFFIYGWNYCKWCAYFLFFLQGAYVYKRPLIVQSQFLFILNLCFLILFICCWYGCLYYGKRYDLSNLYQLISLIPLLFITYFFFIICTSKYILKLYNNKYIYIIVRSIGSLCLEIYLVQFTLFYFVKIPINYPYNIPIICILIFIFAYCLKIFTQFCKQTFSNENYKWKYIIKIY